MDLSLVFLGVHVGCRWGRGKFSMLHDHVANLICEREACGSSQPVTLDTTINVDTCIDILFYIANYLSNV